MRLAIAACLGLVAAFGLGIQSCFPEPQLGPVLSGLSAEVSVTTDEFGVRHIRGQNDFDVSIASGWIHCQDRLFQMDQTRRQVDGTEAELLGPDRDMGDGRVVQADVQARIVGLHRAAQRSFDAAPPRFQALLQAYADGVNACIDQLTAEGSLPPEYGLLQLGSVRPWTAVDSLKIGKAISASLSLDIDTELTEIFLDYVEAGIANGFDGQALFSEDVYRSAPMDPAATVPDATGTMPFLGEATWKANTQLLARTKRVLDGALKERFEASPLLAHAVNRRESFVGSNEAGVFDRHGRPIIANDPHLSLNFPSTFYEWRLTVVDDPDEGPMDVNGVGFPGAPGVILGQTRHVSWGATTNPMDVSDVFLDTLRVNPALCGPPLGVCIESAGTVHPVLVSFPQYFANIGGNLVDVTATLPPEAQIIATVPFRSDGPILGIADPTVLLQVGNPLADESTDAFVLQYVGFHATQELQTFQTWNRAQNLGDFLDGLANFDVGSQNWAYADTDGNLGYFSSAENPLRSDLEQGFLEGDTPPFLVRPGGGGANWVPDPVFSQGQSIPFAVLPFAEMPQTLNPSEGFFVNANNDPAGTTLDNNPLNQVRSSDPGAIYYLNPGYANGLRAGRYTRLIRDKLEAGEDVSFADMKRFQVNTQQLDAELLLPFLLEAFTNASQAGAPLELAALAGDADVAEAIGRLGTWDFSTPTGIVEGWDQSDVLGFRLPFVPQKEKDASVAATIYNVWRGQAIRRIVDDRLADFGLEAGGTEALKALQNLLVQSPYTGEGASGIDFVPEPAALPAEDRRDLALLGALRDALDRLASAEFAPAFGGSTNQEDYCWGKLHRITFDHPFDPSLSVPPAGGFDDLAPDLPGLSRDGGYEVLNASSFNPRAQDLNSFGFGGGPVRRYVGRHLAIGNRIVGVNVMPGGPSGIPNDPESTTQLPLWLTADRHPVNLGPVFGETTILQPPAAP